MIAAGSERWNLAALCIAVAAFFKLYPLAFGLLLAALYPRKLIWQLAVMAGALFLSAGVLTMLTIPHPLWMWVGGIILPLACSYLGARLVRGWPRRSAPMPV